MSTSDDRHNTTTVQPQNNGDHIEVEKIENARAVAIGRGAMAIYQGLSYDEVVALFGELKDENQPTVWDGRIPYLGLKAFRENDAEFFFGREEMVEDLLQRVEENNFVVIAGPSGSGKSSLARAGLFYALREGRVHGSDKWLLATMSPKNDPIEQLGQAMSRLTGSPSTGRYIREEGQTNPLALHEQAEALLTDDMRQRLVLLVDQFEELFTQTKDEEARAAFIGLLTTAAVVDDGRTIIVISLRSDFVSNCALYPKLREQINKKNQFQLVGAMEPRDLAKAITLPSMEVGAEIEPALVKKIIDDMKGEPGALPLMSFAMLDLFTAEKTKRGEPMDLILKEYVDRGGIDKALERHADHVFENFDQEQQELAKGIFSKLITVGEGRLDTRRTAHFKELKPVGEDAVAVAAVVGALSAEGVRLVTTSSIESDEELRSEEISAIELAYSQATVTIAHEKLIDAWPWLRRLIDENREQIALQNQIQTDAQKWKEENDNSFLYRGGRLAQALKWQQENPSAVNELAKEFLAKSVKIEQRERILKYTGFAIALFIIAGFLLREFNTLNSDVTQAQSTATQAQSTAEAEAARAALALQRAEEAESRLNEVESRFLVTEGEYLFGQTAPEADPKLGLALVLEGLVQNSQAENNLQEMLVMLDEDSFEGLNNQAQEMGTDELIEAACSYLLANGSPDETMLVKYFPDREPPVFRACGQTANENPLDIRDVYGTLFLTATPEAP